MTDQAIRDESDADRPTINPDSSTAAVARWCLANRLRASVVGRWVWVPYRQLGRSEAQVRELLAGTGFRGSKRRQAWYHDCGVVARKRVSGKLDRYHRVIGAADFVGRSGPFAWYSKGRCSSPAELRADEVAS